MGQRTGERFDRRGQVQHLADGLVDPLRRLLTGLAEHLPLELAFAAVFLGAPFFAGAALVVAAFALVLVTRPDLVLPRTRETSLSTAGAGAAVLRGLLALALGLAAAFLGAAALVAVFLVAGAFLVVVVFFLNGDQRRQLIIVIERYLLWWWPFSPWGQQASSRSWARPSLLQRA